MALSAAGKGVDGPRRLGDDGAMSVRYVLVPVRAKVDRQERAVRRRC